MRALAREPTEFFDCARSQNTARRITGLKAGLLGDQRRDEIDDPLANLRVMDARECHVEMQALGG